MSSNTNTLFWVITGAVIILAVFLLINNSQDSTLINISDKFSNITAESGIESDIRDKYTLKPNDPSYRLIEPLGPTRIYTGGYKVEVYDVYDTNKNYLEVFWFITNNNTVISEKKLVLELYDCATDRMILGVDWGLEDIKPKETKSLGTWGGISKDISQYYIKARII